MRGAPWEGLFYGFVLEVLIGVGALVLALDTDDFLTRALAWSVFALVLVGAVRIVRRVLRAPEGRERATGRWWFNG